MPFKFQLNSDWKKGFKFKGSLKEMHNCSNILTVNIKTKYAEMN